jgi:uncharacterized membrane-anchored protein
MLIIASCFVALAQPQNAQEEFESAWGEAQKVMITGPAQIMLLDQAQIELPQGFIYIPQPQAGKLMTSMGNRTNPNFVGLIASSGQENWFVTVKYEKSGYIKDDDAKNWDIDELFSSIKAGTEEANKERQERGFPEIEILGWVQKPQYEATKHQLVWSISSRHKGETSTDKERQGINYNTYVLGREGYLTLCLVTTMKNIDAEKPISATLLSRTQFVSGKRYEDFNSSTDKVAEYGLAALVAGVAAKKLGMFAVIAGFLAKFAAKYGLVIGGGVLVGLWKLLGRKKQSGGTDTAKSDH